MPHGRILVDTDKAQAAECANRLTRIPGIASVSVGIAACIVRARRAEPARVLLVALALALLPGMLGSAFDRASLTRNEVRVRVSRIRNPDRRAAQRIGRSAAGSADWVAGSVITA